MRLLFVGTSAGQRGTEQHLLELALAMRDQGHAIHGVFSPLSFLARQADAAGLPYTSGTFRNAVDPRGLASVLRATCESGAEWILASFGHEYWPVTLVARLLRRKACLFRHLSNPLGPASRLFLPHLSHRLVAVSEFIQRRLVSSGVPAARVQRLYNPIDLHRFRPRPTSRAQLRRALGLEDAHVLVGFVGPPSEAKGALTLARAADQAMRWASALRLLWLVPQTSRAQLEATLLPALRGRHSVLPWTDSPELVYPAMDLLAVPSDRPEAFGRVAVEAQACGVPVLVSADGGLPETLEAGTTGELVPPGDVAKWADALVRQARSTAGARRRMGELGRGFVQSRFSREHIAQALEDLLVDSAGNGRR